MDKVIVITGAGGVLCSGFAEFLAAKGAKVALLDINEQAASAVAEKIRANGGTAFAYKCNVLDKADIESVHGKVKADLGACDILINGAGGNNPKCTTAHEEYESGDESRDDILTFFNIDEKGFDFVFDLNIKGVLLPTQVFMPDMIGKKGASVLNISSMNAFRPLTKIPAYSAAKAAVSNFTEWLAVHFAKEGIRVNAIAPGFFVTNQNRALLTNPDGSYTDRARTIIAHTPCGRFAEPEELFGTIHYLISDASSFVTGALSVVDGGFDAFSI